MINPLPIALFAAGLTLISASSQLVPKGEDDTSGYLCKTCDSTPNDEIFCLGYIKGILNTFDAEVASKAHDAYFCIPEGTPLHDIRQAWENYCGAHEEQSKARAASIVALAMRRAYPCSILDDKPPEQ